MSREGVTELGPTSQKPAHKSQQKKLENCGEIKIHNILKLQSGERV